MIQRRQYMCLLILLAVAAATSATAQAQEARAVDHIAAAAIQTAAAGPATEPGARIDILKRGSGYYYVLVWRTESGIIEVHEHDDDIFVVREGQATLLYGGDYVHGKQDPALPQGEIRGGSISGGTRQRLTPGDIVVIPAGIPHQVLLEPGAEHFVYMVVKRSNR